MMRLLLVALVPQLLCSGAVLRLRDCSFKDWVSPDGDRFINSSCALQVPRVVEHNVGLETSASQVEALRASLSALNVTLESVSDTVSDVQSSMEQLETAMDNKVSMSALETLNGQMSSVTSTVATLTNTVNSLAQTVSTLSPGTHTPIVGPVGTEACDPGPPISGYPVSSSVICLYQMRNEALGITTYRIQYNTEKAGYFDRNVLISACAAIGAKPMCDKPEHCDGFGLAAQNSYLSQCGVPNGALAACAGMEPIRLRGGVFYNDGEWNGDNFLGLKADGGAHEWVAFHTSSGYTETICARRTTPCDVESSSSTVKCVYQIPTPSSSPFIAYRVNFNTANPGYFDKQIVASACASLGAKPLCDNPSHCSDGIGMNVAGLYLSQCGTPGSSVARCGQMDPADLRHAVFYNDGGWNGNSFLGFSYDASDHAWVAFHTSSGYTETICARAA